MSRFDWSVRVVKDSVDSCLQRCSIRTHQKWRQQNIACAWWSFVSCLYASACGTYSSGEFNHSKATFQIYKSWNLHYSNSTKTWTGACIIQNQKEWESFELNHKHSHSPQVQVGLQQLKSLDLSLLIVSCFKNNNQCCSCGLSSFRPTEVILTPSRKVRNTKRSFRFFHVSK